MEGIKGGKAVNEVGDKTWMCDGEWGMEKGM